MGTFFKKLLKEQGLSLKDNNFLQQGYLIITSDLFMVTQYFQALCSPQTQKFLKQRYPPKSIT